MMLKIIISALLISAFAVHGQTETETETETDLDREGLSPAEETRGGPLGRPEQMEEIPEEEQEGSTEIGPESLEEAVDEMNSRNEGQEPAL